MANVKQKQFKFQFFKDGATSLNDLDQALLENFKQNSTLIRKQIDKLIIHNVKLNDLMDDGAVLTDDIELFTKLMAMVQTNDPKIVGSFSKVKRDSKALFDSAFFQGKEFGHQDITVVMIRLGIIAVSLQNLEDALVSASKGRAEKRGSTLKNEKRVKVPEETELPAKTVGQLRLVKKKVQTMLIAADRISRLDPTKAGKTSAKKYKSLQKEFLNGEDFQLELDTIKTKLFDVLTGKVELGIKVESKGFNRFKSFFERAFGRNASRVLRLGKGEKLFGASVLKNIDIGEVVGSESINNKVTKDLSDMLQGKKPKKQKTRSKNYSRNKSGIKKKKSNITKNQARLAAKTKRAMAAVQASTIRGTKKEAGNTKAVRDLARLTAAINKRLPAEVRRSMGRPALINRTGRFSNSVRLESLRSTKAGLSGEYSYLLSPYETFENTGKTRWPSGYNPKPLIAKSIRNLAIAYTTEKLTSLRRK